MVIRTEESPVKMGVRLGPTTVGVLEDASKLVA